MNGQLRKCGSFQRIVKYILSTIVILCIVYPTSRSLNHATQHTSSSNEPQSSINLETVRIDNDAPLDDFSSAAVKLRLLEPVFRRHISVCIPKEQSCVYRSGNLEKASSLLSGFTAIAHVVIPGDTDLNDNCVFWRDGGCIHTDPEANEKGPCIIRSYNDCVKRDPGAITKGPCVSWSEGKCLQRAHPATTVPVRQNTDPDESEPKAKSTGAAITVTNDGNLLPTTFSNKANPLPSPPNMVLAATQCSSYMQSTTVSMSLEAGPIRAKDEAKARDLPRDDTPPLSQIPPPTLLPFPTTVLDSGDGQQNFTGLGKCTSWSKGQCVHRDLVPSTMASVKEDPTTFAKIFSSPDPTTSSYLSLSTQVEGTPEDRLGDEPGNKSSKEPDPECPGPWTSPKCLWRTGEKTAHILVIVAFILISISLTGMLFFWARKKYMRRTSHLIPLKTAKNKSTHLNTARPEITIPTYNEMTLAPDMNLPEPQPSTKLATLVDSALPYKEDRYKNLDGSKDGWTKWIHKKIEDDNKSGLPKRSWSPTPQSQQGSKPPRLPTLTLPKPVFTTVRKTNGLAHEPELLTNCIDSRGKGKESVGRIHWGSDV